jgi:peptidoglycan/xylan/chitin deacetylase (PgdA/CDA1 family)
VAGAGLGNSRRRARELATRGETGELRAAGRAMGALVEALEHPRKNGLDPERLAAYRRRAEQLAGGDGDPELESAAREVLELVDRLEGNGSAAPAAAPAAAAPPVRVTPLAFRRPGRRSAVAGAAVAAVGVLAGGVAVARRALAPDIDVDGPRVELLGRAALASAAVSVRGDGASVLWKIDGHDARATVERHPEKAVLPLGRLVDGEHTVEVAGPAGFLGGRSVKHFRFRVDTRPPAIRLTKPAVAHAWEPLELYGTAAGATAVSAEGRAVPIDNGRFVVRRSAPVPSMVVTATDEAGNGAQRRVTITLVPRRPPVPVRAVHVTFYAWADPELRAGVLRLIDEHRVNAVELDLKDESGLVGFTAEVPYGRRIGSIRRIYDLQAAVRQLHKRGVRVIGRLVCFRDPVHAAAAWRAGRHDEVIQTPSGGPYAGYGGFTNFANETVRRYNIDVAVAAARAGVDDVLYDYVRRPDGPRSSMRFPGLTTTPESAIVEFLRESRQALRPFGTYLGASVFGVAATRPLEVAQPIRRMAQQVDYIAPMVYPSHWGPGEYDVANPNGEPYEIVRRSLLDFARDVRGAGARIVPWLQDFSLGVTYGPAEVRAQIDAARRDGIGEFILWDPAVTYTADALSADAVTSLVGLARARPAPPDAKEAGKPAPAAVDAHKAVGGRPANELGEIPVLMHHEIRPDRVGPYDQTPAEFRGELERLWRDGYFPVTASDLVEGRLGDVPAGKTPVVLTFDDSTRYQLFFRNGKLVPNTAVAILRDFARTHPGFRATGTFYVLREPFGGVPQAKQWLRWLVQQGFELGNHTHDHIPLRTLSSTDVQKELALGQKIITDAVPGYRVRTMALPLGSMPRQASLARRGRWNGISYADDAVFLVGANPAASPYSKSFDRFAIPRIRSSHQPWSGAVDYSAAYWLHQFAQHPERRYVSDGDPKHLAFPRAEAKNLSPRFRAQARPF